MNSLRLNNKVQNSVESILVHLFNENLQFPTNVFTASFFVFSSLLFFK
jgi:hypothetical protein